MKIALIGATGTIGQRILKEAISRGHAVTAILRDPAKLATADPKIKTVVGSVLDSKDIARAVTGSDIVVSAFGPGTGDPAALVAAAKALIAGLREAHVKRLLIVGGAGSLEVAPGIQLVDTDAIPAAWKPLVLAHRNALDVYKATANDLDWSYLSPAAMISPGQRTGKFRLGGDQLLKDPQGQSRISTEDFAVAIIDEAESPKHVRKRFSIAY
jgi:putative NADH-flavin reductase